MATVSIDVPAAQMPRVIAAFVGVYNYQTQVPDPANPGQMIANPETKPQFTQRMMRQHAMDVTKTWEASTAGETARAIAVAKVDTEITIT